MAKVYAFPVKKQISEEMKQKLYDLAKEYVNLLNDVFEELTDDVTDEDEMVEVTELMLMAYLDAVGKAIDELEES